MNTLVFLAEKWAFLAYFGIFWNVHQNEVKNSIPFLAFRLFKFNFQGNRTSRLHEIHSITFSAEKNFK